MSYRTVLVAFVVQADSEKQAQEQIMEFLPKEDYDHDVWHRAGLDCWWVAEDERYDGSDNESAVFIPEHWDAQISQRDARLILEHATQVQGTWPA